MERFFNTAGPGITEDHYMVDPLRRIEYEEILVLIRQKRYFVLHAPRQTGKTTSLLAMVKRLNEDGEFACVYVNVEAAQMARNDVTAGIKAVASGLGRAVDNFLNDPAPLERSFERFEKIGAQDALAAMLTDICINLEKPLVLFVDEIDALIGDTLVSVLRQLRSGYADRPERFPVSVILCGVRDIKDYRIHKSDGDIITGGSCFNIKAKSLRLGNFTQSDIFELLSQHTHETGQAFEAEVYPKIWEYTYGQPWLVNALAREVTWEMKKNRDRSITVTVAMMEEAADRLIISRATHLDQLTDKLKEERVRRVIAPMLVSESYGTGAFETPLPDDIQYVEDLGLIRQDETRKYVISNAIYREVIPRELTFIMQAAFGGTVDRQWYIAQDGKINMNKLMGGFGQFFRENIESWRDRFDYKEAIFQLLLQAYLQRIINGGGLLEREYSLGAGRVDLLVRYRYSDLPFPDENAAHRTQTGIMEQRIVVELKVLRGKGKSLASVLEKGLEQTYRYFQTANAESAHLVICDEISDRSWDEKVYDRMEHYKGLDIHVWGM